jgi:hypothetical protein
VSATAHGLSPQDERGSGCGAAEDCFGGEGKIRVYGTTLDPEKLQDIDANRFRDEYENLNNCHILTPQDTVSILLTKQPSYLWVEEGKTAAFSVRALGSGLTYQWFVSRPEGNGWEETTLDGCRSDTISFPTTHEQNGWRFRCRISRGTETRYSSTAVLTVNHIPGEPVQENIIPATTTAEGSYDEVIYCTVCGEVISSEHMTIPLLPEANYMLSETELSLFVGKGRLLKLMDENGNIITPVWKSSDEDVAFVSSKGVVTAKKVGTATITATVDGMALTCDVLVLFKDVTDPSLFYYDPIYAMVDKGVIGGYKDGTFKPDSNCNRAAVVTFLWRLAGKPEPEEMATFSDMPTENEEFCKAISWAAEQEITTGYSDGTFHPWATCNRAAIVTFLWRYAGKPAPSAMATFNDMTDKEDFDKAISWAAENEITTGWSDNTFRPWNTCSRLAIASFLDRYSKLS